MYDKIFDINTFNIFSDDENYYFFRALNNADNNDIDRGITTDESLFSLLYIVYFAI